MIGDLSVVYTSRSLAVFTTIMVLSQPWLARVEIVFALHNPLNHSQKQLGIFVMPVIRRNEQSYRELSEGSSKVEVGTVQSQAERNATLASVALAPGMNELAARAKSTAGQGTSSSAMRQPSRQVDISNQGISHGKRKADALANPLPNSGAVKARRLEPAHEGPTSSLSLWQAAEKIVSADDKWFEQELQGILVDSFERLGQLPVGTFAKIKAAPEMAQSHSANADLARFPEITKAVLGQLPELETMMIQGVLELANQPVEQLSQVVQPFISEQPALAKLSVKDLVQLIKMTFRESLAPEKLPSVHLRYIKENIQAKIPALTNLTMEQFQKLFIPLRALGGVLGGMPLNYLPQLTKLPLRQVPKLTQLPLMQLRNFSIKSLEQSTDLMKQPLGEFQKLGYFQSKDTPVIWEVALAGFLREGFQVLNGFDDINQPYFSKLNINNVQELSQKLASATVLQARLKARKQVTLVSMGRSLMEGYNRVQVVAEVLYRGQKNSSYCHVPAGDRFKSAMSQIKLLGGWQQKISDLVTREQG